MFPIIFTENIIVFRVKYFAIVSVSQFFILVNSFSLFTFRRLLSETICRIFFTFSCGKPRILPKKSDLSFSVEFFVILFNLRSSHFQNDSSFSNLYSND